MRQTCLNLVYELAKTDDNVCFIGSDLSPGLLQEMKDDFPERYFMEGISEMNAIGMAAGMAMEGYKPFVNTIATFITRRCYEQVALDLCLHDLPVRLIANGGGLVYAPLGPTHLAIEDIAIMRALPNMAVVAVCDQAEMVRLMNCVNDWPHPIYIRLAKGYDEIVSDNDKGFEIGRGITLHETHSQKVDTLLISTGICTIRSLHAARMLEEAGHSVRLLHLHTIKPLDEGMTADLGRLASTILTVEEHSIIGGLGSAVTDVLVRDLGRDLPPIKRLGIPDTFAQNYGTQDELLKDYGLQPEQIAASAREFVKLTGAS